MGDFGKELKDLAVGTVQAQGKIDLKNAAQKAWDGEVDDIISEAYKRVKQTLLLQFVKDVAKGCAKANNSDIMHDAWIIRAENFLDEIQEKAEELIEMAEEVDRG